MSNWQDHITQLKVVLETIHQELAPYSDQTSLKEKQVQLQSIENTINQLQKSNTSVPDELRELKFRLLKELDTFSEAAAIKAEIQHLLTPYFQPAKQRPNRKKPKRKKASKPAQPESRITLAQLIDAGVLPVPLVLTRKYKGKIYQANITQKGTIEMTLNGQTEVFDSPSAAAVAATNKSQNGWTWWIIEHDSSHATLNDYRKKFTPKTN